MSTPRTVETDTAVKYQRIRKHQAVLILTERAGKTYRGVILSPGQTQSLIRYNEDGVLRERKIKNERIVAAHMRAESASAHA